MNERIIFKSPEDTQRFGIQLAEGLKPGSVIALTGDLGAGKTALTKAIAKGLGISEQISSPTFTIVQEYEDGRMPLYHFDVYRVNDEEDLFELGFESYLSGSGVCVIEWADLIEELLPEDTIRIHLSYGEGEEERICEIA